MGRNVSRLALPAITMLILLLAEVHVVWMSMVAVSSRSFCGMKKEDVNIGLMPFSRVMVSRDFICHWLVSYLFGCLIVNK